LDPSVEKFLTWSISPLMPSLSEKLESSPSTVLTDSRSLETTRRPLPPFSIPAVGVIKLFVVVIEASDKIS
jgi:hypothetical protein